MGSRLLKDCSDMRERTGEVGMRMKLQTKLRNLHTEQRTGMLNDWSKVFRQGLQGLEKRQAAPNTTKFGQQDHDC